MIDDVVVQELQVARLQRHLEAQLLGKRLEHRQGLVLRGREARNLREALRLLDVGGREVAREMAVPLREDGQRIVGRLGADLVADRAAVEIPVHRPREVRPARQHRVVDRDRADDPTDAARLRLPHAEQPDHVRPVVVPAQRLGRFHPRAAVVADVAHHAAVAVLRHRRAEMAADAIVERAQVLLAVAPDREARQLHHAAAVLQLVGDGGELGGERRQRKILLAEIMPVDPAPLHMAKGCVDLGDGGLSDRPDPVALRQQRCALPGGRAADRSKGSIGHDGASFLRKLSTAGRLWASPSTCQQRRLGRKHERGRERRTPCVSWRRFRRTISPRRRRPQSGSRPTDTTGSRRRS